MRLTVEDDVEIQRAHTQKHSSNLRKYLAGVLIISIFICIVLAIAIYNHHNNERFTQTLTDMQGLLMCFPNGCARALPAVSPAETDFAHAL